MSWQIRIIRAKPNPAGKDKNYMGIPKKDQLLGEWADLQNTGDASVRLSTIHLCHTEFSPNCTPKENPTTYWSGKDTETLNVGQIVRVHTGESLYSSIMEFSDQIGVHLHAFAEKGSFVLNNKCGDIISVWWKNQQNEWCREDIASYDPNPPEGRILKRVGAKLIP